MQLPSNMKAGRKVFTSDFEYIVLPFPYLRLSWNSGDRNASKAEGARHYGGFQRAEEDILSDLASMEKSAPPSGFTQPTEWEGSEGKYMARSARHIYAAPIIAKVDWWLPRGAEKKKHRLDFLVYLASLEEKTKLVPWGMAVISSKNYPASAIEDAFKGFAQDTLGTRRKFARYEDGSAIDAMFFYHCVGTFGTERVIEKIGQSTYVPCQFNKPSAWDEKTLEKYFVGEEVAKFMIERQDEAASWAEDTNENRQKKGKAVPASEDYDEPDPSDDNIPF